MRRLPVLALGLTLAAAPAVAGPISAYYLTAPQSGGGPWLNWIAQGTSATSYAMAHPGGATTGGESAIAVYQDVRTLAAGDVAYGFGTDTLGSQYDLLGTYLGTSYTYPFPTAPDSGAFYDGTTDGNYNYAVDYRNGGVYRMDRDWSNPEQLFGTGTSQLGITYDPTDQTIWLARFGGGVVSHYTMTGVLLDTFNTIPSLLTSLALDHADGTLWLNDFNDKGMFYQYAKDGTLLSTQFYSNMVDQNTLGGEFNLTVDPIDEPAPVPEPGTLLLMSTGMAAIAVRRRRR